MVHFSQGGLREYSLAAFAVFTMLAGAGSVTRAAESSKKNPAASAPAQAFIVPSPEVLLVLVRTTLIALDQANKTGDYTVFREYGSPALKAYSVGQLSDMFANFRTKGVDLAPVAVVTPTLTEAPTITQDKILRLVGVFPTQPLQIHFEILMQDVSGSWRPGALNVRMTAGAR